MGDDSVETRTGRHRAIKIAKDSRVTVPLAFLFGLIAIAWMGNETTIAWLGRYFVSKADAQTLGERVGHVEQGLKELGSKVDNTAKDLSSKMDGRAVDDLQDKIFNMRIQECMAIGPIKTVYARQRADLVAKWRALTGQPGNPPTLLDCSDLGR